MGRLDTTGGLFDYPNLGDTGITLGNGTISSSTAMSTYLDRLYVLDTGARKIWKYSS